MDNTMDNAGKEVGRFMASLDANFRALRRHPFTRGMQLDETTEKEFLGLLKRVEPVTESERTIAAVFQWLASQNRAAFIKFMFEARFASASLVVDGRLIEKALGVENQFSLNMTSDGHRVGNPRPPPRARKNEPRKGDSRKGGPRKSDAAAKSGSRKDEPRKSDAAAKNEPRKSEPRKGDAAAKSPPVLSDADCLSLLRELDGDDNETSVINADDSPAPAVVDYPAPDWAPVITDWADEESD